MTPIHGGSFIMDASNTLPNERPPHSVTLKSFRIDTTAVTVADFAGFVEATGYRTETQHFGWSGVLTRRNGQWRKVGGANWQHPDGPL